LDITYQDLLNRLSRCKMLTIVLIETVNLTIQGFLKTFYITMLSC